MIVVKAEVVRRIAERDPAAAAAQAADIEDIGRRALVEIREAVTGYRGSGLTAELTRAKGVLSARGSPRGATDAGPAAGRPTGSSPGCCGRRRRTWSGTAARSAATSRSPPWTLGGPERRSEISDGGTPAAAAGGGNGLRGLTERLGAAGGTLEAAPAGGGPRWWRPARCDGAARLGVTVIRVLLAEDQGMMRGALALLLDLEPDIEVVAQVATGDQIVPPRGASRPDVALLDIEMPGGDGITATAELRRRLPGCKVLILTTFGRPGYLRRAMEAGPAASW